MDPVKRAFAETIQELVQRQVRGSGLPKVEEEYSESISLEFQRVTVLNCRVRINQGPYKGPRYFDVIVREHI